MNSDLPYKNLGIDNGLLFEIANLYLQAGAKDKYKDISLDVEKNALLALERNPTDVQSYYSPYKLLLQIYENLQEYRKAMNIWEKLKEYFPDDPSIDASIEKYKKLAEQKDSLSQ